MIHLSSEMMAFLNERLTSSMSTISSTLAEPMDSEQMFCPISAVVKSDNASSILPDMRTFDDLPQSSLSSFPSLGTTLNKSTRISDRLTKSEISSVLRMEWLKRRSKFEYESGQHQKAYQSLQEAQEELTRPHVQKTDFNSITSLTSIGRQSQSLSGYQPAASRIPRNNELEELAVHDIMLGITEEYAIYDISVLKAARVLQRTYHNRYLQKCRASTVISTSFRNYIVRRNADFLRIIKIRGIIKIQRRFRIHLIKMNKLATKLKQWYMIRKCMYRYHVLLRFHRAAVKIQRLVRGIIGRKIASFEAYKMRLLIRLQSNIRRFLIRNERYNAIHQIHRLYHYAARTIQCLIRTRFARIATKTQLVNMLQIEQIRQFKHLQKTHATVKYELMKLFQVYLKSPIGKCCYEYTRNVLLAHDKKYYSNSDQIDDKELLCYDAMKALQQVLSESLVTGKLTATDFYQVLKYLNFTVPFVKDIVHTKQFDLLVEKLQNHAMVTNETIKSKFGVSIPSLSSTMRQSSAKDDFLSGLDDTPTSDGGAVGAAAAEQGKGSASVYNNTYEYVDINAFLDWYCSIEYEEEQLNILYDHLDNETFLKPSAIIQAAWYQLILYMMNSFRSLTGVAQSQRIIGTILRDHLAWKLNEIQITDYNINQSNPATDNIEDDLEEVRHHLSRQTRITGPMAKFSRHSIVPRPRFQCCQCHQSFVLFSDFYHHFTSSDEVNDAIADVNDANNESAHADMNRITETVQKPKLQRGYCRYLAKKAFFHYKYWDQSEWFQQRRMEYDVMYQNFYDSSQYFQQKQYFLETEYIHSHYRLERQWSAMLVGYMKEYVIQEAMMTQKLDGAVGLAPVSHSPVSSPASSPDPAANTKSPSRKQLKGNNNSMNLIQKRQKHTSSGSQLIDNGISADELNNTTPEKQLAPIDQLKQALARGANNQKNVSSHLLVKYERNMRKCFHLDGKGIGDYVKTCFIYHCLLSIFVYLTPDSYDEAEQSISTFQYLLLCRILAITPDYHCVVLSVADSLKGSVLFNSMVQYYFGGTAYLTFQERLQKVNPLEKLISLGIEVRIAYLRYYHVQLQEAVLHHNWFELHYYQVAQQYHATHHVLCAVTDYKDIIVQQLRCVTANVNEIILPSLQKSFTSFAVFQRSVSNWRNAWKMKYVTDRRLALLKRYSDGDAIQEMTTYLSPSSYYSLVREMMKKEDNDDNLTNRDLSYRDDQTPSIAPMKTVTSAGTVHDEVKLLEQYLVVDMSIRVKLKHRTYLRSQVGREEYTVTRSHFQWRRQKISTDNSPFESDLEYYFEIFCELLPQINHSIYLSEELTVPSQCALIRKENIQQFIGRMSKYSFATDVRQQIAAIDKFTVDRARELFGEADSKRKLFANFIRNIWQWQWRRNIFEERMRLQMSFKGMQQLGYCSMEMHRLHHLETATAASLASHSHSHGDDNSQAEALLPPSGLFKQQQYYPLSQDEEVSSYDRLNEESKAELYHLYKVRQLAGYLNTNDVMKQERLTRAVVLNDQYHSDFHNVYSANIKYLAQACYSMYAVYIPLIPEDEMTAGNDANSSSSLSVRRSKRKSFFAPKPVSYSRGRAYQLILSVLILSLCSDARSDEDGTYQTGIIDAKDAIRLIQLFESTSTFSWNAIREGAANLFGKSFIQLNSLAQTTEMSVETTNTGGRDYLDFQEILKYLETYHLFENVVNMSQATKQLFLHRLTYFIVRSHEREQLYQHIQSISPVMYANRYAPVRQQYKEIHHSLFFANVIRSQTLASKQIYEFLRYPHGIIQRTIVGEVIDLLWHGEIMKMKTAAGESAAPEKSMIFRYVYCLFSNDLLFQVNYAINGSFDGDVLQAIEHQHILITELPHLIQFLVKRFQMKVNSHILTLYDKLETIMFDEEQSNTHWMTYGDAMDLLELVLVKDTTEKGKEGKTVLPLFYRHNGMKDAKQAILSRARREALLLQITANYQKEKANDTATVGDAAITAEHNMKYTWTAYRCNVLAMMKVIRNYELDLDNDQFERNFNTSMKERRKWLPREAVFIKLMCHGYSVTDILRCSSLHEFLHVPDFTNINIASDSLETERIFLSDVNVIVRGNKLPSTWVRQLSCRYKGHKTVYKKMKLALSSYMNDIKLFAQDYIHEILQGKVITDYI